MRVYLILFVLLIFQPILFANSIENFTVTTSFIPPWAISADSEKKTIEGFIGEVFIGALNNNNLIKNFSVDFLPWKRAQYMAQKNINTFIFPLIRTKERENNYKWVSVMLYASCYAWTIDSNLKIDTLDDIKKAGIIGGLAGAPQTVEVLKLLGPEYESKIEGSKDTELALLKLMKGNIQVFSGVSYDMFYTIKLMNKDNKDPNHLLKNIRRGYKFYDLVTWIAANKNTSDKNINLIKNAISDFKKTKKYNILLSKYDLPRNADGVNH
jgi:polar amino acid transport system substrate-binding protein